MIRVVKNAKSEPSSCSSGPDDANTCTQSKPTPGSLGSNPCSAATNYAYADYYREMAHVHFGLRRLAIEADRAPEDLVEALRLRLER